MRQLHSTVLLMNWVTHVASHGALASVLVAFYSPLAFCTDLNLC